MSDTKLLRQFARAVLHDLESLSYISPAHGLCANASLIPNTSLDKARRIQESLKLEFEKLYGEVHFPFNQGDEVGFPAIVFVAEMNSHAPFKNPKRLEFLRYIAYGGDTDALLTEFAQAWLESLDNGYEEYANSGLCTALYDWSKANSLHNCTVIELRRAFTDLLKAVYANAEYPFNRNRGHYTYDDYTGNPKRRAFVDALAQGRLITDDFGNVVPVKENFYATAIC